MSGARKADDSGALADVPLSRWAEQLQSQVLDATSWMGLRMCKNPLDAWLYQELLYEVRPDLVVEIGSFVGGSTLYLANLLDLIGGGAVLSIDIDRMFYEADHPRIECLTGSSGDPDIVAEAHRRAEGCRVLVIHDGDHSRDAVLRDLRAYADIVSLGSYFVVEDGIVDLFPKGSDLHPVEIDEGPLAAIEAFLAEDGRFEPDARYERYGLTWNPSGYLRRTG